MDAIQKNVDQLCIDNGLNTEQLAEPAASTPAESPPSS